MHASKFAAEPVYLAPGYGRVALSDLQQTKDADWSHQLDLAAVFGIQFPAEIDRPYAFYDGVAFINARGTMVNRLTWSWGGYMTGYKYLTAMVAAIVQAGDVRAVVLDCDSHGGEAAGCLEAGRYIRTALRAAKIPSLALVDSKALSAGYAIACACDKITIIPSGQAGSIGAMLMHEDVSKALEMSGEKITIVAEGSHKADGNPFEPLPADVLEAFTARISKQNEIFCGYVAEMRALPAADVVAMQAAIYDADTALSMKLIDAVAPAPEAFAGFLDSLSDWCIEDDDDSGETTLEVPQMADPTAADGAAAERARVQTILTCPEATGRETLAQHLAFKTSMTGPEAVAMLLAAPVAAPPVAAPAKPVDPLATAMTAAGTPGINPTLGGPAGEVDDFTAGMSYMKSFMVESGRIPAARVK